MKVTWEWCEASESLQWTWGDQSWGVSRHIGGSYCWGCRSGGELQYAAMGFKTMFEAKQDVEKFILWLHEESTKQGDMF